MHLAGLTADATGSNPDVPTITWPAFRDAMHDLVSCSCCGAGSSGASSARRDRRGAVLGSLGHAAWRDAVRRRDPIVPAVRGAFVLPDVSIVRDGQATRRADVLVVDGKIGAIEASGALCDGDFPVIDALRGHHLAPALADLHVHMPPDNRLQLSALFLLLHLRHGVTLVRDAGDVDGTATPAALALVESGALPGPEIHYTDAFVTGGPSRWSNSLICRRADDATSIVERLRSAGASWVKSYENLDEQRIRALVAAAERAGLQVMGHVPSRLRLEDARLPDSQHFFGVPRPETVRRDHVLNRAIDWSSVDDARIDEVVESSLRHGLAHTPTLSSHESLLRMRPDAAADERAADLRLLPGFYRAVVWHPHHGLPAYRDIGADDFARADDALERKRRLTKRLADAGVALRLGTDTQQPFVVPGIALHREIVAMQSAGIPRPRAWRWASETAAAVLRVEGFGQIAPGGRADLIVSQTDPLATGWSSDRIAAVVTRGTLLRRQDLDRAIGRELARFAGPVADFTSRWLARFALDKAARRFVG